MPFAIDPEETWDFTPDGQDDLPEDARVAFALAPLDLKSEKRVAQLSKGQEDFAGASEAGTFILKMGLRGWKNFKTAKGVDAPFVLGQDGKPSDRTLSLVDLTTRMQIVKAILYRNGITEDERKN